MKVLVSGAGAASELPGAPLPDGVEFRFAGDEQAFARHLPESEALLGWDFLGGELERHWRKAARLKWIHWCGAGVDAVLFPELRRSAVVLTNARGVFDRAMAEYVLAYVLFEAKRFRATFAAQADRRWTRGLTERLAGQSALVFGVGGIGRAIARTLRAVGVGVRGVGRAARASDRDFDAVVGIEECAPLVARADWVIGVLPATDRTRGVFDAGFFAACKRGARFINVGRGAALDEAALVEALRSETLAGAMLDVFGEEPLPPQSMLWDAPNLVVGPHMSGDYRGFEDDLLALFLDNLERYRARRPLRNVVDKTLGFVPG